MRGMPPLSTARRPNLSAGAGTDAYRVMYVARGLQPNATCRREAGMSV
jgi:hypothetical protein